MQNRQTATKQHIREALIQLLLEEKFETISVSKLCQRAGINRGTFYLHYLDKYDLLEKIEDNILNHVISYHSNTIEQIDKKKINKDFNLTDYVNINNNFFIVFKEHLKEITILLSSNGSNSFRKKLRLTMLDIFKKTFNLAPFNASNQEKELLFQYLVGGFIAILDYWSENPELTTDELFSFYISAVSNGIVNFVKEKMI